MPTDFKKIEIDGDRRQRKTRRRSDREIRTNIENVEVINPLRMRLFLSLVFSLFTCIVIFSPLWLYLIIIFWLVVDYFVMLGGTLNWLNKKVDSEFKGTGFLRRLLSTDARIVITTTSIAIMVLLADYFYPPVLQMQSFQWASDVALPHSTHMINAFKYYSTLALNDTPENYAFALSRTYIYIVLVRGLLIGSLIHVLHHLLINQHLAGVKFTKYPPLMGMVYKFVVWARK